MRPPSTAPRRYSNVLFLIGIAAAAALPAGPALAQAQKAVAAVNAAELLGGLIDPSRLTTWNPGLQAVGGIPNRTTICRRIEASAFGNGTMEASAAIQAAIAECPTGQVVQLSAGRFQVNRHLLINRSITLRGEGPQNTILVKTNGAIANVDNGHRDAQPLIIIGPTRWPSLVDGSSQNLIIDGKKGDRSVRVMNARPFAPGQFVLLDADEFGAAEFTELPPRNGAPTKPRILASDRVVFMRHDPQAQEDDQIPEALSWFSRPGRVVAEVKEIEAVSGDTITFTTPLHIDYPIKKLSQVTRYKEIHTKFAGVEDLGVTRGSNGAIRFEAAAYSWVKNVENTIYTGEAVAINHSFRVELRDSYIHESAMPTPGGGAYAISFASGSSESLVENNIIMKANKMMVARSSGAGSVVGYNYADDGLIAYHLNWHEVGLNGSHKAGSNSMLFEGNQSFNYDSDNTHGSSIYMTVFRNHLTGFRRSYPGMDNARAAGLNYGSWWHSFAGNVLGVEGRMRGWVYENVGRNPQRNNPFGGPHAIWKLGYQSGRWEQAADPKVLSTVVRQGNFDFVTNKTNWEGSPRPLPPSLYLRSKPAFFGALPWPWVDPEGAKKLHVLPARARFDAGTPFAPPPK